MKKRTPQKTWSKVKARLVTAEATKKLLGSPFSPTVPGPVMSARTFTNEKAPEMIPNPSPDTEVINYNGIGVKNLECTTNGGSLS